MTGRELRALLALGLLTAPPAQADEPDQTVLQALEEGERALATSDAAALAQAAQMLVLSGARPLEGEDDLAAAWRQEARALGDGSLPGLAYRGAVLGPAYKRGTLAAGARFALSQLFLGGQPARIRISATQGALSLKVRGVDGGLLCERDLSAGRAACDWLPPFTGRFDISVENSGPDDARFFLLVK